MQAVYVKSIDWSNTKFLYSNKIDEPESYHVSLFGISTIHAYILQSKGLLADTFACFWAHSIFGDASASRAYAPVSDCLSNMRCVDQDTPVAIRMRSTRYISLDPTLCVYWPNARFGKLLCGIITRVNQLTRLPALRVRVLSLYEKVNAGFGIFLHLRSPDFPTWGLGYTQTVWYGTYQYEIFSPSFRCSPRTCSLQVCVLI